MKVFNDYPYNLNLKTNVYIPILNSRCKGPDLPWPLFDFSLQTILFVPVLGGPSVSEVDLPIRRNLYNWKDGRGEDMGGESRRDTKDNDRRSNKRKPQEKSLHIYKKGVSNQKRIEYRKESL